MTTGLVALLATAIAQDVDRLDTVALQLVADQHGLAVENLSVVNSARASFPLTRASAHSFKVLDSATNSIFSVALDGQGKEVSTEAMDLAETTAVAARYGKLDPKLADFLVVAAEDERLAVSIWLSEPAMSSHERMSPEEAEFLLTEETNREAYFAQVDAVRTSFVNAIVDPFASRLNELGVGFTTDSFVPVVYAFMTPQEVRDVANWAEIERIYLAPTHENELDMARQVIYAPSVNAMGITGAGVKIAQIEVGGRVATTNPFLAGVIQDATFVCGGASGHSTAVAGMLRSTHATVRGVSYGATLRAAGSCGGWSSELQNRSTVAADWGASAMNLSWGSNIGLVPGSDDRFYDSLVMNRARTVVKSAGNQNGGCGAGNGNVTSPGLAYNVITVGNFNDFNTLSFWGDAIEGCSSFKDPTSSHGDREKPEVAAPGTNFVSTTTAWPFTGGVGSGTSYSAPMVTGTAALMMQRNSALTVWPESVKAILMATATHNIEGATRLSEYDGAGGILASLADQVVRRIGGNWGGVSYSCAAAADTDMTSMYLTAGRRVRVVIAWDNDPAYVSYASQPCADLDLQVLNPAGTYVSGSASWDNSYEVVDFTATTTGWHKLRVKKYRCDLSPRYLGWAWYHQ